MNPKNDMSKAYEAGKVEERIYDEWLKSGFFSPEGLPDLEKRTEAFTIVLPPPNVTGTLHMGHAVMLAIEDAMVRFARMSGKRALWIPGTDHAAIATESKVEKVLMEEEGKTRHDLGREAFLKRVDAFAKESHDTIVNQMKKMGASVDWEREAYTLDADRNLAVRTAFVKMYEDGLIYRGFRVVNWDPLGQTTVSDDEVEHVAQRATLYTFRYGKEVPIAISTTRPETKVGDTAIAVHPDDPRYANFIGETYEVDFAGVALKIRVIGDFSVDPNFGTGALGVTPAHSQMDAEIARTHDLPSVQVIGKDGCMMKEAGNLVEGLTTKEAREKIVSWLKEEGLMEKEEEVEQQLSVAQRSGGAIEPLPMEQWFIDVNKPFAFKALGGKPLEGVEDGEMVTLKKLMRHAVLSEQIHILPERFAKTYFHWIDNLRDWNISRQIWFGHRVPVWYRAKRGIQSDVEESRSSHEEMYVGVEAPEGEGWIQDSDTLDTWFSSGLWTFSTLGWPRISHPPQSLLGQGGGVSDLATYHPTSVLETGYDILFFWVARMILMSTYLLGEVPFETVYLHGLVRDEKGRKMSKSLGNIINPLDMIEKYGADATRLSLLIGGTPGNDSKLSEEKIAGYRNFTNKLWNISRFVFGSVENGEKISSVKGKTLADKWILSRLSQTAREVTAHYESHQLSLAGEKLRDFTWNEFADWYLEIAKVQKAEGEEETDAILLFVLETLLRLWHPLMPFVTEEVYKQFGEEMLIVASWPKVDFSLSKKEAEDFTCFTELVVFLRGIRNRYKIPRSQELSVFTSLKLLPDSLEKLVEGWQKVKMKVNEAPNRAATTSLGGISVKILLEGVDIDAEMVRIKKEMANLERAIQGAEVQLNNEEFLSRAKEEVIEGRKRQLLENIGNLENLAKQLDELS